MKKAASLFLGVFMMISVFTGCATNGEFDKSSEITVVSREDGSGTRSAFVELVGVEEKDANGNKEDKTSAEAIKVNTTAAVMTTVAGDNHSIGYISLGSMNNDVKALKVDGVEATTENVSNGTYKISRPFNIVTGANVSDAAQDFINFIMSEEGQKVIADNKYIEVKNSGKFTSTNPTGKITVAGSSSVTPVMEKLAEAYKKVNSGLSIEVQQSDSSTGVTSVIDGICDIGMASRDLKDSETEKGAKATVIAMDGIAVVVNNNNPLEDISVETIKTIFKGETKTWNEVIK